VLGSLGTSLDPHSWTTGYPATNYTSIITIIIHFFIIYMPSQQVQGQLQEQRSVSTVNYSTDTQKRKDKSHRACLRNTTVEKLLVVPYTTEKCIRSEIRTKIIPVNNEVVLGQLISVSL
jgi:hypothetical protein